MRATLSVRKMVCSAWNATRKYHESGAGRVENASGICRNHTTELGCQFTKERHKQTKGIYMNQENDPYLSFSRSQWRYNKRRLRVSIRSELSRAVQTLVRLSTNWGWLIDPPPKYGPTSKSVFPHKIMNYCKLSPPRKFSLTRNNPSFRNFRRISNESDHCNLIIL